jgi:hypothetical protein
MDSRNDPPQPQTLFFAFPFDARRALRLNKKELVPISRDRRGANANRSRTTPNPKSCFVRVGGRGNLIRQSLR